ncbi:MAG: hypothetical protein ACP5JJ_13995, partial [Anaerolineae bacterium]
VMKSKGIMIALVVVVIILVAALAVLGYSYLKGGQANPTSTPSSIPTEAPIPTDTATREPTPSPVLAGDVVIPDTTKVLNGTTLLNLTAVSEDRSVYTFSAVTEQLSSLKQGDVIVGISDLAPDGFLRKVESVSTEGDQVVVQTQQATLAEAIETGSLSLTQELRPQDVRGRLVQPGVQLASASLGQIGEHKQYLWIIDLVDVLLFDADGNEGTTGDQIRADGSIRFNMSMDFRLHVVGFELRDFYLVGSAAEYADIRITGNAKLLDKHLSKSVGSYVLNAILVPIGPVPVWITPILNIEVGLDGTASIGIEAGIEQEVTLQAGLQYTKKSGWKPIGELTKAFEAYPPRITGNLEVEAYGSINLGVLLYGVVGIQADISGYFGLHVDLQESPPLALRAGLRSDVGVWVTIFGWWDIVDERWTVIDFSTPLPVEMPITGTPTATHTPSPTPTPTPTATPTPTPTARPPCAFEPEGTFVALWQEYKQQLGCPLDLEPAIVQDAEQAFDRGRMLWRADTRQIYLVYEGGTLDGIFYVFADTWQEGDPIYSCEGEPPVGRVKPWRGFGKIWCQLGGPSSAAIGWALEQEKGFSEGNGDPMVQDFEEGVIFRDSIGAANSKVYIFFTTTGRFVHEGY